MNKPCRGCKSINLFDYDGSSVAEKEALKDQIELLKHQNQRLLRLLRRYKQMAE